MRFNDSSSPLAAARRPHPILRRLLLGLAASLVCRPLAAAPLETFDTPGRTWQLRDRDVPLQLVRHQRVFDEAHGGSGSELVAFQAEQGTYIHLSHALPPSRVHPELTPTLWVKAERPGVQLLVRVVLPRAADPQTGQPVTVLIAGDKYAQAGQWQQLRVADMATQVQRQLRALRAQSRLPLDDTEAYIDMLVVNAYQGPGLNRLWLDDLDVLGHVRSQTEAVSAARQAQRMSVEVRGDVVLIDRVPRFLRMVRYRGEPLELLKQLGFNTVYSEAPASPALLEQASRQQMWVVAAPSSTPLGEHAQRVVAWTTGPLGATPSETMLQQRAAMARAAQPVGRPLVGDFQRVGRGGRDVDILLLGRSTRNSSIPWSRYTPWLQQQRRQGRLRTPLWVRVELDASPQWQRQMEAWGLDSPARLTPAWAQLRTEAFAALAAGARGMLVDTRQPLQAGHADARSAMARLLTAELELLEPWFAGGEFSRLPHADENLQLTQVATDRSLLLLAIRHASHQEHCEVAGEPGALSIVAPARSGSTPGFRLTRGVVEPLRSRRVPGGAHLTIEQAEPLEVLVVSQDALVMNHVSRHLEVSREERARRLVAVAFERLGWTAETDRRLAASDAAFAHEAKLQQGRERLDAAQQHLQQNDFNQAAAECLSVLRQLSEIRRRHWERRTSGLDPMSSPALLSFDTLPLQDWMERRTAQGAWSGNVLGGGNLEDRASVEGAGWRNYRGETPGWHTDVSFAPEVAQAGRGGLRLSCVTTDRHPRAPAASPIVIESPAVPLRLGQTIRVSGWVRIPKRLEGLDGLLIHDSVGGRDLALRIHEAPNWTPFEFYRVASDTRPLVVTWELTEKGEAWIDEVSVSIHQGHPPARREAPRAAAAVSSRGIAN